MLHIGSQKEDERKKDFFSRHFLKVGLRILDNL